MSGTGCRGMPTPSYSPRSRHNSRASGSTGGFLNSSNGVSDSSWHALTADLRGFNSSDGGGSDVSSTETRLSSAVSHAAVHGFGSSVGGASSGSVVSIVSRGGASFYVSSFSVVAESESEDAAGVSFDMGDRVASLATAHTRAGSWRWAYGSEES